MNLRLTRLSADPRTLSPPLRILLVEDAEGLCKVLESFLHYLGHQTRPAKNVAAALDAGRDKIFDVLLSDLALPDGTGWNLLRQLRRLGRGPAHAIAMSVYGLDSHLTESASAGFDLHLIKPFHPEELEGALNGFSAAR